MLWFCLWLDQNEFQKILRIFIFFLKINFFSLNSFSHFLIANLLKFMQIRVRTKSEQNWFFLSKSLRNSKWKFCWTKYGDLDFYRSNWKILVYLVFQNILSILNFCCESWHRICAPVQKNYLAAQRGVQASVAGLMATHETYCGFFSLLRRADPSDANCKVWRAWSLLAGVNLISVKKLSDFAWKKYNSSVPEPPTLCFNIMLINR